MREWARLRSDRGGDIERNLQNSAFSQIGVRTSLASLTKHGNRIFAVRRSRAERYFCKSLIEFPLPVYVGRRGFTAIPDAGRNTGDSWPLKTFWCATILKLDYMKRFILIDHSITGLAGHHYEYAVHVLRAAETAGYEPVLVTNRAFQEDRRVPWTVLPLFEFGFWPEHSHSLLLRCAERIYVRLCRTWFWLKFHLRYSEFGFAWIARHEWFKYLRRRPGEVLPSPRRLATVSVLTAVLLVRAVGIAVIALLLAPTVFAWSVYAAARFLLHVAAMALHGEKPVVHNPIRSCVEAAGRAGGELRRFPRSAWNRLLRVFSTRIRRPFVRAHQARAFGRDAGRMLRRLRPADGDILFFPTISEHDLSGLADYLGDKRQALGASWHFLFRRNIYEGRRAEYAAQDAQLENLRLIFERVERGALYGCSFFYTDTEELSEQWERLGIFRFHTLPIPHTYASTDTIPHRGPLRLTYLGDARAEKGFPLLPELVAALEWEYMRTGKARLVAQCNFNVPAGEPTSVVARGQLESLPSDYVQLHKAPLTSEGYKQLLLTSDINLLLYVPLSYYARSSGILVESLAVGIPVIVPSGCWLSRQFLEQYTEYIGSLSDFMQPLKTYDLNSIDWYGEQSETKKPPAGGVLQLQHDKKVSAFLDVPYGATHVLLRIQFSSGADSAFGGDSAVVVLREMYFDEALSPDVRAFVMEASGSQKCAAICLAFPPGINELRMGLSSAYPNEKASLRSVGIEFLRAPDGRSIPRGAVGLIYRSVAEIPSLVRDLIDNYGHYRRTAIEFSRRWREYHNSDRLVRELEGNAMGAVAQVEERRAAMSGATV
jgi:hypothetical protein